MYVIAVYDVDSKRVAKMLKICRKYLNWIQNSVFEGQLSVLDIEKLKHETKLIMQDRDSLIIFKNRNEKWLTKEVIGMEKSSINNFL